MNQESSLPHQERNLFEQLRCILEKEQKRPVSFEEASDVGSSLISFYETLADGSDSLLSDDTL